MVIGITGLIGSGKSKIGSYIANTFGISVEDCDDIAHDLYGNADVVNKIENAVGKHRNPDNSFSRSSLLKYLLKNPNDVFYVNNIIHPIIIDIVSRTIVAKKAQNQHLVILAPLLFECEMQNMFNKTVYIYTDEQIRIKRLIDSRGLNKKTIDFFDKLQIPASRKFSMCDHVFLNNSDIDSELNFNLGNLCMKIF